MAAQIRDMPSNWDGIAKASEQNALIDVVNEETTTPRQNPGKRRWIHAGPGLSSPRSQ